MERRAFEKCKSLKAISLPAGLSRIDDGAFSGCSALETVLLPYRPAKLGRGIFFGCDNLLGLVVPDSRRLFRHIPEKWSLPAKTQVIRYSELKLALLFAEYTDEGTSDERKAELQTEIKERLAKFKKRNKGSMGSLKQNLDSATTLIKQDLNQ